LARLSDADKENISRISQDGDANEFRLTGQSSGGFGSPGDNDAGDNDDDDDDRSRGSDDKERKSYEFVPTHFSEDKSLPRRKVIYKYFRFLLKSWEWDLNKRPEQEKRVVKGKMETKMQKQCRDYIRHLFKLCKRDEVPPDIEDKLFRV
jgi:pre-mRNA-splicing factor 18